METIFPIITKKMMFSSYNRNCIRNKIRKFKILFFYISFNLLYIYIFSYIVTFWKSNERYYLLFNVFIMQLSYNGKRHYKWDH